MKERSQFWDNYKGILIFLVVFCHFIYAYAVRLEESLAYSIYTFVYTFHMPAFVFCTGYFSKSERSRSKNALVQMFLYYAVFNSLMMWFAHAYLGSSLKLLTPYYSYWYILAIIMWRAVAGDLGNVKGIVLISALVTLALGGWKEFTNVLALRRTVAFFVFFIAGYKLDREKVERFLQRRKPWHMALGAVLVAAGCIVGFWAVKRFGITDGMTMMAPYGSWKDLVRRVMLMMISFAAIAGLFLIVPNRKIPLLTKFGRNSLIIYVVHRFITIIYYKEFFTYKTYTDRYLLYALLATVVTCVVVGGEELNDLLSSSCEKAAAAITDPGSKAGRWIKTILLLVLAVVLCLGTYKKLA